MRAKGIITTDRMNVGDYTIILSPPRGICGLETYLPDTRRAATRRSAAGTENVDTEPYCKRTTRF